MDFRSELFWWNQFNLSVQITRYFVICKFRIAVVSIFVSLTFRLEFKIICKAERTIKLPNKNVTNVGDGWGFRKIILWATERRLKQFSKPLLREFAVLRLLGVLSPMEIWRKPHPSPAYITSRPAAQARHTNPDL